MLLVTASGSVEPTGLGPLALQTAHWACIHLTGFFPVDEASSDDWRFTKLQAAQAAGMDTVGTIMQWYGRALTLTP